MKKILGIYNEYKIMPNLQMHQLRVASVASLLCDSIGGLDKESVITACLFHDMGNIVKFYLPYFPQLLEPEGLAYWQNIKDEYIKKYGSDEHKVTEIIAREIKMPEKAYSYLSGIGFSKAPDTLQDNVFERKICCYADQRVAPFSVVSLQERIDEGHRRYAGTKEKTTEYLELASKLFELEKQIFAKSTLKPSDITDESIAPIIERLKKL